MKRPIPLITLFCAVTTSVSMASVVYDNLPLGSTAFGTNPPPTDYLSLEVPSATPELTSIGFTAWFTNLQSNYTGWELGLWGLNSGTGSASLLNTFDDSLFSPLSISGSLRTYELFGISEDLRPYDRFALFIGGSAANSASIQLSTSSNTASTPGANILPSYVYFNNGATDTTLNSFLVSTFGATDELTYATRFTFEEIVPEPSRVAYFALAGIVLILRRRRGVFF